MTPPPISDGEGEVWSMGTLRGLEHSLNPVLTKYAHETEHSITTARKELRQNLFAIYPDMPVSNKCSNLNDLLNHNSHCLYKSV